MASRKKDASEAKAEKYGLDDIGKLLEVKLEETPSKKVAKAHPTAAPVRRKVGRPRKAAKVTVATKKRPYPTRSVVAKSRSSDESSNPVGLLDMLAEVASATLEKDLLVKRRRRGRKASNKSQRKPTSQRVTGVKSKMAMTSAITRKKVAGDGGGGGGGGGSETLLNRSLSLDQIRVLPDKTLLQYFSELTADEIRRNYSYVCYLVPEKCNQKYTSFGNDNRARMQMKSHLLGHIAELLADATSHSRASQKSRFTAEPLAVRKLRLMSTQEDNEESGGGSSAWKRAADGKCGPRGGLRSPQAKKWKSKRTIAAAPVATVAVTTKKAENRGRKRAMKKQQVAAATRKAKKSKPAEPEVQFKVKPKRRRHRKELRDDTDVLEEEVVDEEIFYDEVIYDDVGGGSGVTTEVVNETGEVITVVQQPLHDHSYTINKDRKRRRCERDDYDYGQEEEDDDNENDPDDYLGNVQVAYICVEQMNGDGSGGDDDDDGHAVASSPTGAVNQVESSETTRTKQAEMALRQLEAIRLLQIQKNKKAAPVAVVPAAPAATYPSSSVATVEIDANTLNVIRIDMPQSTTLAVDTRTAIMQAEQAAANEYEEIKEYDDEDDKIEEYDDENDKEISLATSAIAGGNTMVAIYDSDTEKAGNVADIGSPEWERKLALKYIRMLRLKKKDEHVPLVCRICEGQKCFTAQATLMYHYRSHAGIKPFVCGICQTTFTRQHSLNYHMLIHNNKSRFTCGDCGRQFRHPSHFKEHLRRHTGETPFECTECGVRFKTRNTYKRHLKTRHGKLLTVNGIVSLSDEEFMKVKTNPKRKLHRLSKRGGDVGYADEEEDDEEEDLAMDGIDIEAAVDEPDGDETEDAIAVKSLEQQTDIVQAAVEAIIQDEALEQQEEDEGVAADEDGTLYTFYSIGVGRDPLNGKEIILLEAVPQSSVRQQQQQQPSTTKTTTAESIQQPQAIVQCI